MRRSTFLRRLAAGVMASALLEDALVRHTVDWIGTWGERYEPPPAARMDLSELDEILKRSYADMISRMAERHGGSALADLLEAEEREGRLPHRSDAIVSPVRLKHG